MLQTKHSLVVVAVVLSLSSSALAQDVPPKVKELQSTLVGSWKGTGSLIDPSGKAAPISLTYDCKSASTGFAVSCALKVKMPDGFLYESTDMWGYSAGDGLVHWFTVTNAGETHDHKGSLENGQFSGQFEGPLDGKLYVESIAMTFSGKTAKLSTSVMVGGKQHEKFEATIAR